MKLQPTTFGAAVIAAVGPARSTARAASSRRNASAAPDQPRAIRKAVPAQCTI